MLLAREPLSRLLALATAMSAVVGCTTAPPTAGYTPITGIEILAADITAGHGCGTAPDQVYKYAAVLGYAPASDGGAFGPPLTSGVFDCFADGVFSNLPTLDGGVPTFSILVFAYNLQSYPPALQCGPSAAPCPGDDAGAVVPLEGVANWTTRCTATQTSGVTSPARCGTLAPSDAGPSLEGSMAERSTNDGSLAASMADSSRADTSTVDSSTADASSAE